MKTLNTAIAYVCYFLGITAGLLGSAEVGAYGVGIGTFLLVSQLNK